MYSNLLALLDYVNQGLSLEDSFTQKVQSSEAALDGSSGISDAMSNLPDALAINQLALHVSHSEGVDKELNEFSQQILDAMVALQTEENIRVRKSQEIGAFLLVEGQETCPLPDAEVPLYTLSASPISIGFELPWGWRYLVDPTLSRHSFFK